MPAHWDTLTVGGDPMRVYVDAPAGRGPHPGVIVAMHAGGVEKFIESMVERLAAEGYAAAAPDLYHRQKDDDQERAHAMSHDNPERMKLLLGKAGRLRDLELEADINATVAHLRGMTAPRVGSLGITGFCLGGRVVFLMTAKTTSFQAGAAFYPAGMTSTNAGTPATADLLPQVSCPVVSFSGDRDQNPTPADIQRFDAALTEHGTPHRFHVYPGVGHNFFNQTNPVTYNVAAATDAWLRLRQFFHENLAVPASAVSAKPAPR